MTSKNLYKIELLQTVPGRECSVATELRKACLANGKREFLILKGLGGFDILFIYKTKDFGFRLTSHGPILGILKYNQILCYDHSAFPFDSIFDNHTDYVYGISIVKLYVHHMGNKQNYFQRLNGFADSCLAHVGEKCIMGTLGWNDFVVLLRDKSINTLAKNLLNIGIQSASVIKEPYLPKKTHSYVGITYESIFGEKWYDNSEAENGLSNEIKSVGTDEPIPREIHLSLSITLKPAHTSEAIAFWDPKCYQTMNTLGASDLDVSPLEGKCSWGTFIHDITRFRVKLKDQIVSTNTKVTISTSGARENDRPPIKEYDDYNIVEYGQIKSLFSENITPMVATKFYILNSLLQNPISSDAYFDLAEYPSYLMFTAYQLKDRTGKSPDSLVVGSMNALDIAMELRAYGTSSHLESNISRYAKLKGGVHKPLLALYFLPSIAIQRLGIAGNGWQGFINAWESKFFHLNEVIYVPIEALWNPLDWWAVYHEIGHVLIDKNFFPILSNTEHPIIKSFLENKIYPNLWIDMLSEFCAEIIGYELCFFDDYDLFFDNLWKYLKAIKHTQADSFCLDVYIVRSFFVYLWSLCKPKFPTDLPFKEKYGALTSDEATFFELFISHIERVEAIFEPIQRRSFIAAGNIGLFKDIIYFATELSDTVMGYQGKTVEGFPSSRWLGDSEVIDAYDCIVSGEPYPGTVKCPEAILYKLLKNYGNSMSNEAMIATILTFFDKTLIESGKYA